MNFWTYRPAAPLSGVVDFVWYCQGRALSHAWERLLPDTRGQLLINLVEDQLRWRDLEGRPHAIGGSGVSGPSSRPFDIDTAQQGHIMGASFREGQMARVMRTPLHLLLDDHVELVDIWSDKVDFVRERILEFDGVLDRCRVLSAFLAAQLISPQAECVAEVLGGAKMLEAGSRVKDVCRDLGWSYKKLERRFRRHFGVSPSKYSRLKRFERVWEEIARLRSPDWVDLALSHGYSDQSHLVREVGDFSTFTPSRLTALPRLSRHIPLLDEMSNSFKTKVEVSSRVRL